MPVMRRDAKPHESLFLHEIYGAEHYAFHETVHGETLDLGAGKGLSLELVCYDICGGFL